MSTKQAHLDPERRHDFLLLFDVQDGNPNGDPDAGNLPRVDPETMHGLVSDVAIKRKVRDYVGATRAGKPRMNIYVEHHGVLNEQHEKAYREQGLSSTGSKQDRETVSKARAWMADNFFDIRTFGAVMTTGVNAGAVRGPVQITFARSVSPVVPLDLSITRVAVTRAEDAYGTGGEEEGRGKETEMGRKSLIPYGLYVARGFVNPHFAKQSGFDGSDLATLWEALERMWDLDRSSARGFMACQRLFVFSHESPLGNAAAHRLFRRVAISPRDGVAAPRSFEDFAVTVDEADLPAGVTLTEVTGE